jgi:hypothetical protein
MTKGHIYITFTGSISFNLYHYCEQQKRLGKMILIGFLFIIKDYFNEINQANIIINFDNANL